MAQFGLKVEVDDYKYHLEPTGHAEPLTHKGKRRVRK